MKNNIVLIGMPGVGKSTVGVVLAKNIGFQFVDSDLVIQEQTGKLLHEIISEQGTEGFLEIENRINASLKLNKSIIATGGSAIYGEDGMKHLNEIGCIVYLKLSLKSITERLGDLHERGVALKEGQTLKDLYEERVVYYEKYANLIVDCENKSIRELVSEIASKYKKYK